MRKKRPAALSVIFEVIFATGFFMLACAVGIRFFASAALRSEEAYALRQASLRTLSATETAKAHLNEPNVLCEKLCGELSESEEGYSVFIRYDEDFEATEEKDWVYTLCVSVKADRENEGLLDLTAEFTDKNDKTLYEISLKQLKQ